MWMITYLVRISCLRGGLEFVFMHNPWSLVFVLIITMAFIKNQSLLAANLHSSVRINYFTSIAGRFPIPFQGGSANSFTITVLVFWWVHEIPQIIPSLQSRTPWKTNTYIFNKKEYMKMSQHVQQSFSPVIKMHFFLVYPGFRSKERNCYNICNK